MFRSLFFCKLKYLTPNPTWTSKFIRMKKSWQVQRVAILPFQYFYVTLCNTTFQCPAVSMNILKWNQNGNTNHFSVCMWIRLETVWYSNTDWNKILYYIIIHQMMKQNNSFKFLNFVHLWLHDVWFLFSFTFHNMKPVWPNHTFSKSTWAETCKFLIPMKITLFLLFYVYLTVTIQ